jgi:hypothetical protein
MTEPQWTCSIRVLNPDLERLCKLAVAVMRVEGRFSAERQENVWALEIDGPLTLQNTVAGYVAGETVLDDAVLAL